MGYLSVKDEGNQFFKHVPHFPDFTQSSGSFSLNMFKSYLASYKQSLLKRGVHTCTLLIIKNNNNKYLKSVKHLFQI